MAARRKRQSFPREGPEGDSSLELKPKFSIKNTSTPHSTSNVSKSKKKSPRRAMKAVNDSDDYENMTPDSSPNKSSKKRPVSLSDDSDIEIDLDDMEEFPTHTKKSKVNQAPGKKTPQKLNKKESRQQVGMKASKRRVAESPATDISWEMAVEKARGLPDGAQESDGEESFDEDEIDVDAPAEPPKSAKSPKAKSPKVSATKGKRTVKDKKKTLNVIQNATKKLKKMTGKGGAESPKNGTKRKSSEGHDDGEKKKTKVENMTKKEKKIQRKKKKVPTATLR